MTENSLGPANKYFFNETGIYLRRLGFHDKAINNYEIAIKIDPDDPTLYFNLA